MCDYFDCNIITIKGVGQKRAQLFAKLGVDSVGALLRFYPRSYEDWSHPTSVIDAVDPEDAFIRARVLSAVTEHRIRQGMTLYKAKAADENGTRINLTFFNNPYIKSLLFYDTEYVFHGRIMYYGSFCEMTSPAFRPLSAVGDGLIPIYPQTEGLSSRQISQAVANALDSMPESLPDPLPEELRSRFGLIGLAEALRQIHRPESMSSLEAARHRMVFEEFLIFQLGLFSMKTHARTGCAPAVQNHSEDFFSLLPFSPTGAQRRAVAECLADMKNGGCPMSRLLQGDVGSGKTVVAAALCVSAARSGWQSALMAPTEILAEQHYQTFSRLLEGTGIRIALLTGSVTVSARREIYAGLASGEISIAIGTHALISEGVSFAGLGLVITDEQHRFGVGQRTALFGKGTDPHMLVMSATPIPRTLALMIFGDLEISVLDEMPSGRIPIKTLWIDGGKRERAYGFIKKNIDAGRQAYIVCPTVNEGETGMASAEGQAAELAAKDFTEYRVGLLHGRMKPADKEYVMRRFAAGELDLLVATTVIEVGVDVPNAAIMLIENAERFGLSQLHQLRGRVGRGQYESYCILVSDSKSPTAVSRLNTMVSTSDGFKISSEDLKLRGPGDFFGFRQHGLPALKIASFENDMRTLSLVQAEAQKIIASDPTLSAPAHRLLRKQVDNLFAEPLS